MIFFIDYENVHNIPPAEFFKPDDKVLVFLGQKQNALKVNDIKTLLALKNVELIQIEGRSKNNVDFHICYYLGKYTKSGSDDLVIISKDRDYDNLVEHLVNQGISCHRIPFEKEKVEQVKNEQEIIAVSLETFKNHPARSRPRRVKTLSNFVKTRLIPKNLKKDNGIVEKIIEALQSEGIINIENQKIEYLK